MLKYITFKSASWATKAINLAIKGQNEDWLGSLTPAGLVGLFLLLFLKLSNGQSCFSSAFSQFLEWNPSWVSSAQPDLPLGLRDLEFQVALSSAAVLQCLAQGKKTRHSLCLVLPSFPSFGVADSTVAPTLRKWDKIIRENRLRGFFPKKVRVCLNISFDFSILY